MEAISRKDFGDDAMYNPKNVPYQIGYYIAGFVDGEGSFNFSFRRRGDYKSGWKVSACFNVSNKDTVVLKLMRECLQCGTLRSRPDGVWYYEVNTMPDLIEYVVPFFREFPFLSDKKKNDFLRFCEILEILQGDSPRSEESIKTIMHLRNQMNYGGKRKFSDEEILAELITEESSETIRQTQRKL